MARALEKGPEAVGALERLIDLHERIQRRNAELEFAGALARFQDQCPAIPRTSSAQIVTKSGGSYGYKYADFEQIVETTRPHLRANGFSFTFDAASRDGQLVVTGTLRHINGHLVTSSFSLPTSASNPGMSEQQKVGAAMTFAKRQVLCSLLGLSLTDPEADGQDPTKMSESQVANLRALLSEVDRDGKTLARLLALLGVDRLEDALARQYDAAVRSLENKRGRS
jgi:hypothetical protein